MGYKSYKIVVAKQVIKDILEKMKIDGVDIKRVAEIAINIKGGNRYIEALRKYGEEVGDTRLLRAIEEYEKEYRVSRSILDVMVDAVKEYGIEPDPSELSMYYLTTFHKVHRALSAVVWYIVKHCRVVDFKKLEIIANKYKLSNINRFVTRRVIMKLAIEYGYTSKNICDSVENKKVYDLIRRHISNPRVAAAVAEYLITDSTQNEISVKYSVSSMTLRNNIKKLMSNLGIKKSRSWKKTLLADILSKD